MTHYKLHKVKKRWLTLATTMATGLLIMTVGTGSASADSTDLDTPSSQTVTVVQPINDGKPEITYSQDKTQIDSTELAENQSEEVSQSPQSDTPTRQGDKQKQATESISDNSPVQTNDGKQAAVTSLMKPASDGAVVVQQAP